MLKEDYIESIGYEVIFLTIILRKSYWVLVTDTKKETRDESLRQYGCVSDRLYLSNIYVSIR